MAMHEFLAELYGTNKTAAAVAAAPAPNQEEIDKQAHVQLFLQAAAQEGLDLNALPSEKVAEIYASYTDAMAKAAGASQGGATQQTTDVDALARAEHAKTAGAQAAYQEKIAEADFAGRVMAHAYVQELTNITKTAGAKTAGEMPPAFRAHAGGEKRHENNSEKEEERIEREKREKAKGKDKEAGVIAISNLDRAAAQHAMGLLEEYNKTAGANGFDMAVAEQKLSAVLVLGPNPSEKTAGIADFDQVKHIRGLELLSQAGYPVNW